MQQVRVMEIRWKRGERGRERERKKETRAPGHTGIADLGQIIGLYERWPRSGFGPLRAVNDNPLQSAQPWAGEALLLTR